MGKGKECKMSEDTRLLPAQKYHAYLMRQADDALWDGNKAKAHMYENEASYIKKTIEEGDVWHPTF